MLDQFNKFFLLFSNPESYAALTMLLDLHFEKCCVFDLVSRAQASGVVDYGQWQSQMVGQ